LRESKPEDNNTFSILLLAKKKVSVVMQYALLTQDNAQFSHILKLWGFSLYKQQV